MFPIPHTSPHSPCLQVRVVPPHLVPQELSAALAAAYGGPGQVGRWPGNANAAARQLDSAALFSCCFGL